MLPVAKIPESSPGSQGCLLTLRILDDHPDIPMGVPSNMALLCGEWIVRRRTGLR